MAELVLTVDKGLKTSGDPLRFPNGFLTRMRNAIYLPDFDEQPFVIPGRVEASTLPTAIGVKDFTLLNFKSTQDKMLLYANGRFYEADAGDTLGSWSEVQDQTPAAFVRSGDFVKSVPDTLRRSIVWTGEASERPLVRDPDGNWRYLSLHKPDPEPTLALTAVAPVTRRPAPSTPPTVVAEGAVGANFEDEALAGDGDIDSFASARRTGTTPGITASEWTFDASIPDLTEEHLLTVSLATSSLPIGDVDYDQEFDLEPISATIAVRVSLNAGVDFTTIYTGSVPVNPPDFQFTLPVDQVMGDVVIQAVFNYISGVMPATARIYDLKAKQSEAGGEAVIDAGTYYYAVTEVYRVTLADGRTITAESAPSNTANIEVPEGSTVLGIELTLAPRANLDTDGTKNDPENNRALKRIIYRSTKSGTYPDLGQVGEAEIDATTWMDDFGTNGETLGSPGLRVVYLDDASYPLAGTAPAFYDAAVHSGALVAIPAGDPTSLRWAARGFPDYWPVPQGYPMLPRDRDDVLRGVVSINDKNLIVFMRTSVWRVRDLPMTTEPNFETQLSQLENTLISPSEGLAGTPKAYCLFHSQKGHAVVAWVSDSGIWMTDGTLPSERGMGLVRLTSHKNWAGDVDLTRLLETALTFDPVLQAVVFDYYNRDGAKVCEYLHVAAQHWVQSGEDQMVPKLSGPHTLTADARAVGEEGNSLKHWSLQIADGKILLERSGEQDDGSNILTHIEGGWTYPAGPLRDIQLYGGTLSHSDWGAGEACSVDILVRRDDSGVVQTSHNEAVPLRGQRFSDIGAEGSGRSVKFQIKRTGKTSSLGKPLRYFGPLILEMEKVDEVRED